MYKGFGCRGLNRSKEFVLGSGLRVWKKWGVGEGRGGVVEEYREEFICGGVKGGVGIGVFGEE